VAVLVVILVVEVVPGGREQGLERGGGVARGGKKRTVRRLGPSR
jgi:hypothetical protein